MSWTTRGDCANRRRANALQVIALELGFPASRLPFGLEEGQARLQLVHGCAVCVASISLLM